jgi:hypothetical protein
MDDCERAFPWLYTSSQKEKILIKRAKIKFFFKYSIAIIRKKFKGKKTIFLYKVQSKVARNKEECLFKNLPSFVGGSQIWLKSSYEWSPLLAMSQNPKTKH